MTKTTSMARTGLLAVLLAMVGFSYSLATSNSSDAEGVETAPRAVGSVPPLAFANPFVTASTDRDLGDAVAGSALTRLVRAKGGIPPYTFTAAGTATQGLTNVATTLAAAQIQLLANGILTQVGTQVSPSIPQGPFRFQVTVKDSFGTAPHKVTETFRLTFVTTTQFRFARDTLPDGYQYTPYSAQVPTINGKPAIAYTVSGTGLVGTGLGLSKDGVLYGVPIKPSVTFTAVATDANNKLAAGRTGTGNSQTFTIVFAANKKLASTISATKITVKTGFPSDKKNVGTGGVAYKGIADLGAESISSLSGKAFNIRIGTYTGPITTFDGNGNANSAKKLVPAVKVSLKKLGVLSATITKDAVNVGTISGSTVQLPVEIRLGDAVIGSEYLTFTVKANAKGGNTLTYKGDVSNDTAGSAQLLKVQGADDKAGTGDSWKVAFLGRFPASLLGSPTSVNVSIGTNYSNTVTLTNKNGKLTGKGSNKSPVVSQFSLDTTKNGKGSYTTGVLSKSVTTGTGIPQASTGAAVFFATNLTFSGGAGMDGSLALFAKKTKWASQ